jgi:hypothetical protein
MMLGEHDEAPARKFNATSSRSLITSRAGTVVARRSREVLVAHREQAGDLLVVVVGVDGVYLPSRTRGRTSCDTRDTWGDEHSYGV